MSGNNISSRASPTMKARQILKRDKRPRPVLVCCFARFAAYHVKGRQVATGKGVSCPWQQHDFNVKNCWPNLVAPYSTDNHSILYDSRPIFHRQSTDIPPTVDRYSTDNQWLTYRPSVGRYIDRDIGRRSVDTSIDTRPICRSTYRPIYRPTYLGRYIGRVSVDMSTDISVECRSIYRPTHRSRGAQNTHDLPSQLSQIIRECPGSCTARISLSSVQFAKSPG